MPTKDEINNFTIKIEEISKSKKISLMEAIIIYCEQTGMEIEMSSKLISKQIKTKIQHEAESLNYLKKTQNRLF